MPQNDREKLRRFRLALASPKRAALNRVFRIVPAQSKQPCSWLVVRPSSSIATLAALWIGVFSLKAQGWAFARLPAVGRRDYLFV